MKTRMKTLAMAGLLICSFALTSTMARADSDYYYQGHRGRWAQQNNTWQFADRDGYVYRQRGHSWGWYNGRHHGPAGSAYHNRAYGDNRSYNQFEREGGR